MFATVLLLCLLLCMSMFSTVLSCPMAHPWNQGITSLISGRVYLPVSFPAFSVSQFRRGKWKLKVIHVVCNCSWRVKFIVVVFVLLLFVGTGIVTSVPSDSPDDYAALRDLKNKKVVASLLLLL